MPTRRKSQAAKRVQPASVPPKVARKSEGPAEDKILKRPVLRLDDIGREVFKFFDRDTLCALQFHSSAFRDFVDGMPNAPLYTVPYFLVTDDKNGKFDIRLFKGRGRDRLARFKLAESRDRLRHIWTRRFSICTLNYRMTEKLFATVCDIVRQVRPPVLHFEELHFEHSAYNEFPRMFSHDFVKRIMFDKCTMPKKFDADSFVQMCARNGVIFVSFELTSLADGGGKISVTDEVILDFCFGREAIPSREAVGLHVDLKENSSTFLRTFLEKWHAPNITRRLDCCFTNAAKQRNLETYKSFEVRSGDEIFLKFDSEGLGRSHGVFLY